MTRDEETAEEDRNPELPLIPFGSTTVMEHKIAWRQVGLGSV